MINFIILMKNSKVQVKHPIFDFAIDILREASSKIILLFYVSNLFLTKE